MNIGNILLCAVVLVGAAGVALNFYLIFKIQSLEVTIAVNELNSKDEEIKKDVAASSLDTLVKSNNDERKSPRS